MRQLCCCLQSMCLSKGNEKAPPHLLWELLKAAPQAPVVRHHRHGSAVPPLPALGGGEEARAVMRASSVKGVKGVIIRAGGAHPVTGPPVGNRASA